MKKIEVQPNGRVRVYTENKEESMTNQSFKEAVDANNIIAKYRKTGEFVHVTRKTGVYADVSQITDYATSLQKVIDANGAFMTLPAQIRARFQNDPAQLLAFMQDPKNYDEGVELGIFEAKPKVPAARHDNTNANNLPNANEQKGEPKPNPHAKPQAE